jgi:hypothetical protein
MKNKRLLTSIVSIFAVVILACVFFISRANATTYDLFGNAWSGNVGWITFNCASTSSCSTSQYKVTVDGTTGELSGYAWSDNVGWIYFDPTLSSCPAGNTNALCKPKINYSNNNAFGGYAKVLSADGDAGASDGVPGHGWEGWIDLSAVNASSLDSQGIRTVSGYAWGSGVLGWIDMSGVTVGGDVPLVYVTLGAAPSYSGAAGWSNGGWINNAGVGGMTTISWTSTNATSCAAGAPSGWTSKTSTSGSEAVMVHFTTTFTITCTNGTASATASKTVTVGGAPRNLSVNVSSTPPLGYGTVTQITDTTHPGTSFLNSIYPTYYAIKANIYNPNRAETIDYITIDAGDSANPPEIKNNSYQISTIYPCGSPGSPVSLPFTMPTKSLYCVELPVIISPRLPSPGAYRARFKVGDSVQGDEGVSNDFFIDVQGFGATKKIKVIER